jgi:chemotaxis response regulator CheB
VGWEPVKVLLVDDDAAIRHLLKVALSLEDRVGEVREATDGVDALRVCRDFEPDVIFLDYWMPEMNGQAAAAHIREMHPAARIIVFSGVVESKPEWADRFFTKGTSPSLGILIDRALA